MPFVPIKMQPGISREPTDYANVGHYYDCDKIRFRFGYPQKIGGWERLTEYPFVGVVRAFWNWISLSGNNYLAVGTSKKLYIEELEYLSDITPIRETAVVNNPFTFSSGFTSVQITDTAHGAAVGDYVTISGVTGPLNGVPMAELNAEFAIATVIDADNYTINVTTQATSSGTPVAASITLAYQIPIGIDYAYLATGWGSGSWGGGPWGSGSTLISNIRLWSLDNYGEDLVANYRDGPIYYWDKTLGLFSRAVNLSTLSGASDVPTIAAAIAVTDDRHTVAFGCNDLNSSTQDRMLVRWSDQEDPANWTPAATNTSGTYRLTIGSYIVGAKRTRQEVLIWTDSALYSMQFAGPPYTFKFTPVATNLSIASPNAMVAIEDTVYWMGLNSFYMYNGRVQKLPCPIHSYIFSNFSTNQITQIHSGTNEKFDEIWWFYATANATYPDRYVIYNYVEQTWAFGTMERTAWLDLKTRAYPAAASTSALLYHESGNDDNATGTPVAISAYAETSVFELNSGNGISFVRRIIPDVSFEGSDAASPAVTMTVAVRDFPGQAQFNTSATAVTRTATVPIETFTNEAWIRIRGREISLKVASSALGVAWQSGMVRLEVQKDGSR